MWAMAASHDESGVGAAMKALSQAMVKSDTAALNQLMGDKLMYSHSNGKLETKAEAIAAVAKEGYKVFTFSNMKTEVYGNTALVRCDLDVVNKNMPEGLKINILHVWMKNAGKWQLVGRQSTRYIK